MREFKPGIFEIPPGQTRYGRREFVGYSGDRLVIPSRHLENSLEITYPFHTFSTFGSTPEDAFKALNAILETYIKGTVGHIHWRFGPLAKQLRDGEWQASASLIVNSYIPPIGPRTF